MIRNTLFVALAIALLPVCLFAIDGQVLINQSTLNAAGGTYTINAPGSYKLSGNLQAKDKDTSVILISTSDVTIDLNGFSILGPADCSAGFPCKNIGSGIGIMTEQTTFPATHSYFNITIRNGTVQGVGGEGIWLFGDSITVEKMQVRSNGRDGIAVVRSVDQQFNAIVRFNNVQQNGGAGIITQSGQITDNVVTQNQNFGIDMVHGDAGLPTGTVARNVVTNNLLGGLLLQGSVSYIGNVLSGNNVTGGFNQGQNLCGGATCPGAVF
jgi:hypothetical protein